MPLPATHTAIELAYLGLHQRLTAYIADRPGCPKAIYRNRTVASLLDQLRDGTGVLWNLVDETSLLIAQEIGGDLSAGPFDISQPAILEMLVVESDDDQRNRVFDQNMRAVRDFSLWISRHDMTMGDLVSSVVIDRPPQRLITEGLSGAKAARITFSMLMSVDTILG